MTSQNPTNCPSTITNRQSTFKIQTHTAEPSIMDTEVAESTARSLHPFYASSTDNVSFETSKYIEIPNLEVSPSSSAHTEVPIDEPTASSTRVGISPTSMKQSLALSSHHQPIQTQSRSNLFQVHVKKPSVRLMLLLPSLVEKVSAIEEPSTMVPEIPSITRSFNPLDAPTTVERTVRPSIENTELPSTIDWPGSTSSRELSSEMITYSDDVIYTIPAEAPTEIPPEIYAISSNMYIICAISGEGGTVSLRLSLIHI